MKRIDLPNPVPRKRATPYVEFRYDIAERALLPEPRRLPAITLRKILASRRSRREFRPIPSHCLNQVLWYSARAIRVSSKNHSTRWQHRPSPSAGGRHPIDILVLSNDDPAVYLYQPEAHALARLQIADAQALDQLLSSVHAVINPAGATILWFAAQFDRTLSCYHNGESLVWRDTGALTATISLVAECCALNSCAIGISGEPFISKLL